MSRILLISISISFILCCCAEKPPVDSRKMTAVLTDCMLLEGGNQVEYNYANIPGTIWNRDYAAVCARHQLDTNAFRAGMEYLVQHPEEFTAILENVITRLQKQEMKQNQIDK